MVTAIVNVGKYDFISGSRDGTIAMWNLKKIKERKFKIKWYACNHNMQITSLDYNTYLDLVASASMDDTIALNIVNSGKFVRKIKLNKKIFGSYSINQVRFSTNGYIIVFLRPNKTQIKNDLIAVFTINGEFIQLKQAFGEVNCCAIDKLGYQFITGGKNGALYRYSLLTLACENMFHALNKVYSDKTFLEKNSNKDITSLIVFSRNLNSVMIFSTTTGETYIYRKISRTHSPNLILSIE